MTDTVLTAEEVNSLADKVRNLATQLDAQVATATPDDALSLSGQATTLRNQATRLLSTSLTLRNNETGLDAAKLGNAIDHCNQVVARVGDIRKTIQVATALLTFVPSVASGNVVAIVKAGVALDKRLSSIESGTN